MDGMGLDLAEQAAVWERVWGNRGWAAEVVRRVRETGPLRRVVFTGCGDCHAASEYGSSLLGLRSRLEAWALPAMELSRARSYLLDPETLVVALSASGRTPRVLEAVRVALDRGSRVIGVSDDPESPLAAEAPLFFPLGASPVESLRRTDYRDPEAAQYAGYQRAVPQTKTHGALSLVLACLCLELERAAPSDRGGRLPAVEEAFGKLPELAGAAGHSGAAAGARLAGRLREGARLTFCGTGLGRPAARYTAYKLLELAWPAACCEIEEYCHTWYLVTEPGDAAVFFCHDEATLRRAREIAPVVEHEIGACALLVTAGASGEGLELPAAPPEVSPLLFAHAGAHLARALATRFGLNTDRFRAGLDEERYVRGSTRMIRNSEILVNRRS